MRRFCPDRFLLVAILRSCSQLSCQGPHICTVSLGSLPESLSELGAGTTFFFFFFGICFAAGTHSCSPKRGSDSSVSLLSGAIFRFFEEAPLPVLAFFYGFLSPETWAFAGGASAFALVRFSFPSSLRAD